MAEAAPNPAGSAMPSPKQADSAPMGVSPATGPTPNKGYEAAAVQAAGAALQFLQKALPLVGANSEIGKVVLDCINKLVKIAPPGSQTKMAERNELDQAMQRNAQQVQTQQQLGKQGGGAPQAQQMPGMAA